MSTNLHESYVSSVKSKWQAVFRPAKSSLHNNYVIYVYSKVELIPIFCRIRHIFHYFYLAQNLLKIWRSSAHKLSETWLHNMVSCQTDVSSVTSRNGTWC